MIRRRFCAPLLLGPALAAALLLVAPVARSQGGFTVAQVDAGTFGLQQLQYVAPSLVFRPLDMLGVRAGAEGWAMGGANVAHATGIGAIAWNPAGLGWTERPSIAGELESIRSSGVVTGVPDTFNIPGQPRFSVRGYEVNLKSVLRYKMLGAGRPIHLFGTKRVVGALSLRRYLDVTYPEVVIAELSFREGVSFPVKIAADEKESGGVDAAAVSAAVEIIPGQASIGVNLNLLDGRLRSNQEYIVSAGGYSYTPAVRKVHWSYRGLSTDLGIQYRREGLGGVGVRYTPSYTLAVTRGRFSIQEVPGVGGTTAYLLYGRLAGYDMVVPRLLTVGLWIEPRPWLKVAADLNSQKWSETEIKYREAFVGREQNPSLPLRDVESYHFGAEANLLKLGQVSLPFRLGYQGGPLSVAKLSPNLKSYDLDTWPGGEVKSNAYDFGIGFEVGNVRYDLSYEVLDYKIKKFYFDEPYNYLLNDQSLVVKVDRRVTLLRLGATLLL